jgi:magnesium-transporting ATPase (P-type)
MATSGNFGNMFSLIFASIFLPFLPLLPIQMLAQNLLYDVSQVTIPFDNVDKEYLLKPRNWDGLGIKRFMFWFGPVSTIFDIMTYLVLSFVFKANTLEKQAFFQTGSFMVGLATQTLIVHLIRTAKRPFIESRASKALIISTLAITFLGLLLPYTVINGSYASDFFRMVYRHYCLVYSSNADYEKAVYSKISKLDLEWQNKAKGIKVLKQVYASSDVFCKMSKKYIKQPKLKLD